MVEENEKVESPGMKHRHYAPNTKTILIEYAEDKIMVDKVDKYINNNKNIEKINFFIFDIISSFLEIWK